MDSLLDRTDGTQMELIPSSEMPARFFSGGDSAVETRNPIFTAARYNDRLPDEYKLCVSLLFGDRLPIKTVATMLGHSRNLIAAVYEREAQSVAVEHLKQVSSVQYRTLAKLGREKLLNYLLHLPDADERDADGKPLLSVSDIAGLAHKLGVLVGIAEDKAAMLSGQVTQHIQVTHAPDVSAYEELLSRAREMASGMDFGDGAHAQKGDPAAGALEADFEDLDGASDVVQAHGAPGGSADGESRAPAGAGDTVGTCRPHPGAEGDPDPQKEVRHDR